MDGKELGKDDLRWHNDETIDLEDAAKEAEEVAALKKKVGVNKDQVKDADRWADEEEEEDNVPAEDSVKSEVKVEVKVEEKADKEPTEEKEDL